MENDLRVAAEGFYRAVAEALECDHDYKDNNWYIRRWNRSLGNGRFVGHGVVRRFSASNILINLHTPKLSGLYHSEEAAIDAIKNAVFAAILRSSTALIRGW